MHTAPMADYEGEFGDWRHSSKPCDQCGKLELRYKIWESSCGGYEDYHYRCFSCGHTFWVDGIDS